MLFKVFAIYDSKVKAYATPFFLRETGEALREFGNLANNPKTRIGEHPEDYTLFELGTWDEDTAKFVAHDTVLSRAVAHELLTPIDTHTSLFDKLAAIAASNGKSLEQMFLDDYGLEAVHQTSFHPVNNADIFDDAEGRN